MLNTIKKRKYVILIIAAILLMIAYLLIWIYTQRHLLSGGFNPDLMNVYLRIIGRRAVQLLAIVISVILISASSLVFQTLTSNRILTPSVLGFDSIFLVTQTVIVALLGITSLFVTNELTNFIIASAAMIGIIIVMYNLILRKNKNNIVFLLLLGLIISQLARSVTNFIQVFMNPEEFQSVIGLTTVSLTNISVNLVYITVPLMAFIIAYFYKGSATYDVMALGENNAISLGVDYNKKTKSSLIFIAIAVAISTSLIGPLSFLGLIAVNGAREVFKTNNHKSLIISSSLVGIVLLLFGQVITEIFDNRTSVSVLINLIGGLYMIYLIIKENKA